VGGLAAAALLLAALQAVSPAQAGGSSAYAVIQTYLNPEPDESEEFGAAVAWLTATNQVVVGVPGDTFGGGGLAGSVYLLNSDTGAVDDVLQKPVTNSGDLVGYSLAVVMTNVVVGAPGDDTAGSNQGMVYLFDSATGTLVHTYQASSSSNSARFGHAVAIISDTIVAGAPEDDSSAPNAGRVHWCDLASSACPGVLNNPLIGNSAQFGYSLAVVGQQLAVGAPFDAGHGTVLLYNFDGVTATLSLVISDTVSPGDEFGRALAAVGDRLLVGAPADDFGDNNAGAAYLYEMDGTLVHTFTNPVPHENDRFGATLASDGVLIAIGAPNDDAGGSDAGAVHIFDAVTFAYLDTVQAPSPTALTQFGTSLAATGGGEFVAGSFDTNGVNTRAGAVHRIGVQTEWRLYLPVVLR